MASSIHRRDALHLLGAAASGLLLPQAVHAQAALDEERTRILRSLAPDGASRPATTVVPGTRRTITADDRGAPITIQVDSTRSVDLSVYFAFDSAVIGPEGARTLLALGQALRDPKLIGARVLVAGHTDARGDLDYNVRLSFRRARSVREHLAVVHGIEERRMLAHGFGPTQPKVPSQPLDPANRRVEIALVVD